MRFPKPWYRPSRGLWYVTLNGKQHNLGPDEIAAFTQYKELLAHPPEPQVSFDCVAVVIDAFLDWTSKHRAARTFDWYQERLQWFVEFIPKDLTVAQLKPFHVQQWIDSKNCSDGHKRGCVTAVQRAIRWAHTMGHIDSNPIAHMEKPQAGKRDIVIRSDEFKQIIHLCYDQEFRDLLTVAWEVGPRPQEILAVEARHVELKNCRWVFPTQEAKGKKQPRIVYLTNVALEITKRRMLKWPTGSIFRNAKGQPWHRNNVNCRFQRMKKHIGKKLCLYNFRHSFATRLLEEGVDSLIVAALLGHADLSMLGRVYAHLTQNLANLLEQLRRRVG